MKKTVTVLAILAAVAVIAYSQRATIAARLMERGLESRMGADTVAELEDGLVPVSVTCCTTTSSRRWLFRGRRPCT